MLYAVKRAYKPFRVLLVCNEVQYFARNKIIQLKAFVYHYGNFNNGFVKGSKICPPMFYHDSRDQGLYST